MARREDRARTVETGAQRVAIGEQFIHVVDGWERGSVNKIEGRGRMLTFGQHNVLAARAGATIDLVCAIFCATPAPAALALGCWRMLGSGKSLFLADRVTQCGDSFAEGLVAAANIGAPFLLRLDVIRLFLRRREKCGFSRRRCSARTLCGWCRWQTLRLFWGRSADRRRW